MPMLHGLPGRTAPLRRISPSIFINLRPTGFDGNDRVTSSVKRTCGDCTLCCKVMAIEALAKPASAWCRHCKPGCGCTIYADRPAECENFACLWLVNDLLDKQWKPSRSKLVLTTSEDGIEIRCDPGSPNAWRKEPYAGEIRAWAAEGERDDMTVVVIAGQRMILVTPDLEFDLGLVGPDERIVRELEGTKVVGATVVKAGEIRRG